MIDSRAEIPCPSIPRPDPTPKLVLGDPWLAPYTQKIRKRILACRDALFDIDSPPSSWDSTLHAYRNLGLHVNPDGSGSYREWAPAANQLWLTGDFNNWSDSLPLAKCPITGIWEISLAPGTLAHGQRFKVRILDAHDNLRDRIPAWATYTVQNPETLDFSAQIWAPPVPFAWKNPTIPAATRPPLIYEAHTGMAGEEPRLHSYEEFRRDILPRIASLGYNTIQLMAVQEHPYYGSFGYHVSSFFAPSSRFGSPDDLKRLIDDAHGRGIAVLLDIVHSHAVKNIAEGLNDFDGSGGLYFTAGAPGDHPQWDSKCFAYSKPEVRQFLLSNIAWWLEEFRFDGFRFDGVTSMLYLHHGTQGFNSYADYFNSGTDPDAITYLQLASLAAKSIRPDCLLIAEDMSGMPGLCRPVTEGGLGFDFRLAMGIPDYWIKLLKHVPDENWNLGELWSMLDNRRKNEAHIAYAESHDQALVGDKTLAFWLMDKDMYWHMAKSDPALTIERGIALHKLIRLITLAGGGDGWLNFMGNEFGHPEWIDFPREGNQWSFDHCRRQWSLVDSPDLKYQWLNEFDRAMIQLARNHDLFQPGNAASLVHIDDSSKVIVLRRANLLFVFCFSPDRAIPDYAIPGVGAGNWNCVLDSDSPQFGGQNRRMDDPIHHSTPEGVLHVYMLPRSAQVFALA